MAFTHLGQHSVNCIEDAGRVDAYHLFPGSRLELMHAPFHDVGPGIIKQNIDLPKALVGPGDELIHLVNLADIGRIIAHRQRTVDGSADFL